jgi:hypothetical protein
MIHINPGAYHSEFDDLFREIGVAVGVGIVEDYWQWCIVHTALWPEPNVWSLLSPSIGTEWILRMAGVSS